MILTSLLIPVWKTKNYTLDMSDMKGDFFIYLKRSGFFYAKNEKGLKIKFGTQSTEQSSFLAQTYADQRPVRLLIGAMIPHPGKTEPVIEMI